MMSALMLSDIARETGGELTAEARVNAVSTDSRAIASGELFVALTGERFDGNRFVDQVAEAGAAAAVVSRASTAALPQLIVNDTREALGLIARMNRRQFQGPLVALTGSAGKTTCKDMLAAILGQCGETLATQGNFNNEIGVPLTLLRLAPQHRYAVVEMGASRRGDIAYLARFAEPTIALVTNAMAAHIAGLGDLAGVAHTKGQLFESVAEGGRAVINLDDAFADQWRRQAGDAAVTTFSRDNPAARFYARDIRVQGSGETVFTLCTPDGEIPLSLQLLGVHNVVNAVAAAAAAVAAGAEAAHIKAGLESVRAANGRMQAHRLKQHLLIDDSYNANPGAVRAAIDVLAAIPGRRCLIMGTMGELGDDAAREHAAAVDYAREAGIDQLLMVGEYAESATRRFGDACADMAELLETIDRGLEADVVLVKGSRSAAMERVVEALITNDKQRGNR